MYIKVLPFTITIFLVAAFSIKPLYAQSYYTISKSSVGTSGGGIVSNDDLNSNVVIGQSLIGVSTSENLKLNIGLLTSLSDITTFIERIDSDKPIDFVLKQNYPNPFNPSTQIRFAIPEQAHIKLEVFNSLGQRVATLVNETQSAGRYEVVFDATGLSSGIYLYRLQTESHTESRQMLLAK